MNGFFGFRPGFIAVVAFLLLGLAWSGGHVAWLVVLGIYVVLSAAQDPK